MDFSLWSHLPLLLVLLVADCSDAVDYSSPLVFDPLFYIQTHVDLIRAGIDTPEEAKQHWLATGIAEGRQGCGSFHSKQYLARYDDLSHAFGHDYKAAISHYLTNAGTEHRIGYKDGGFEGRWTISHDNIYLSVSSRMGGAIDSLVWNNKEMINARDHGRELQMACNTNTYTECYNPTEAGGRDDSDHDSTHTHIDWIKAHGNVLESQVHPAFWLRSGTHETGASIASGCHSGSPALNHKSTYSQPFWKKVTIGVHGISNCIEFISNFTIDSSFPHDAQYVQMEAPTGYMSGDFTSKYSYNTQKTIVENYNNHHHPVVLATPDGHYAMGAYAPAGQQTDIPVTYGASSFNIHGFRSATNKWNVVFRKKPPTSGVHPQVYKTYICVGSLNMVSNCLHKITSAVPRV